MISKYDVQHLKWNSLFVRLLCSFLIVIALLLSFNLFSFAFFKTNVHEDIVNYNILGLSKSVESYEKHFSLIEYNLLQLATNRSIEALGRSSGAFDFTLTGQALEQIKQLTGNPLLFLNNIIVYAPTRPYFVEKNGTGDTSELFVRHYASRTYDAAYWKRLLPGSAAYEVLPAAQFYSDNPVNGLSEKGTLFPIVIRRDLSRPIVLLSFVDGGALFERFHFSPKDSFLILDASGRPLYRSGDTLDASIVPDTFPTVEGHIRNDKNYLFYKKGTGTGFIYVNVVPTAHITGQISRLNLVLVTVLGSAVLIAFAVSVWLSLKFNNPIRTLISVFQKPDSSAAVRSNIRELDYIGEKLNAILRTEREIRIDLQRKNSLLQTYGYLDKVKKLHRHQLSDPIETGKPFRLVLFQLHFTSRFRDLAAADQAKASYYMQELIALQFGKSFSDTTTLQVEHDQVVSLLFGELSSGDLLAVLERFKQTIDKDKAFCLLTIAMPPELFGPGDLAAAYEEARHLLREMRLVPETQIIQGHSPEVGHLIPSPAEDQQLSIQLQAGERDRALELLGKCMRQLEDQGATAYRYRWFAREVASKLEKALLANQLDRELFLQRQDPYAQIEQCLDTRSLEAMLTDMIEEVCAWITERKARQDPVKDFVLDYIARHYRKDLSLESAADQLQMSRSYLSTYFREKTGMTFTDYLNTLRMSKAKELLSLKEDVRIAEVASEIGYRNVNSFIRMFKKICGVTPGEYRRTVLQQKQSDG